MKPSEFIKLISPNGYIDTGLMYESIYPNAIDICTLYKGNTSLEVLDKLSKFNSIDIEDVERDKSLLKNIEHPGQIIGGYAISEELADTITSYFGREALLESGRPVNKTGYYNEDELTNKTYLNAALLRCKHFLPYNLMHSEVGSNKNNDRSLESAIKAYKLCTTNIGTINLKDIEVPSGNVYFIKDNMLSLDSFHITLSIAELELLKGKQLMLDWIPEINTAYCKYRTKEASIPYNYAKDSGKAIKSLFEISKESDKEVTDWEVVDTTNGAPIYIGKNNNDKVVTILSKTYEEIVEEFNTKIKLFNDSVGSNLGPVLLSTMKDLFFPTIFMVHR